MGFEEVPEVKILQNYDDMPMLDKLPKALIKPTGHISKTKVRHLEPGGYHWELKSSNSEYSPSNSARSNNNL